MDGDSCIPREISTKSNGAHLFIGENGLSAFFAKDSTGRYADRRSEKNDSNV